ncbi:MAG TPA: response regulator [Burkholderiaceae bacterium]|nr:response regulator [Burkholderiaceae bacterium]
MWLAMVLWSIAVAVVAAWWLRDRLDEYRSQTSATATVRLAGARDALSLSIAQLAALPLNLSHRQLLGAFIAADAASRERTETAEIAQMLDEVASNFGLPLVSLVDRSGQMIVNAGQQRLQNGGVSVATRQYFIDALAQGSGVQFVLGRVSRAPGLYFAHRILHQGTPVGVVFVKQDVETLNRLLGDTGGARLFATDGNGVVVLSNRPDLLLKRLPGPPRPDAFWQDTYQRVPEVLPLTQTALDDASHERLVSEFGDARFMTMSSALADTPLKLWVLESLGDEPALRRNAWLGGALIWLLGGVVIWLTWRRLQSLDAALAARREIFELTQALPLTVFRYTQPADAAPRFAFLGRGVEDLFGVPAAAIERDPALPWRLAGIDRPPIRPLEFCVEQGDTPTWILADSTGRLEQDGSAVYNGYWLDITVRRETQARFAALFEHAPTGYLFFDARRGITHCNPAGLRMFGTSDPHALLGRILFFPGLSPEHQADGRSSRERALDDLHTHTGSGQRVNTFEWRFRRIDGRDFDAEVSVVALEWAATPAFCAVILDVTERKQLQAETERARAAAEAASQTKSSFLANMSHELRTPMNAIIGMTHLALEDGLPPKQRDFVEKAHGAARNLLQILNDILDVSKIEAGQLALERIDFELDAVVSEMADVLGLRADEKGLELLFSAAPGLPRRLIGDPTRLRQVLVNLGGNAIKFTDRGEVTVGMALESEDAESVVLHGSVRDTGVGLSEEALARLFQPFAQGDSSTTRRFGGTGLGLVISRQLVERMGGRLWVESTPGQGSTFHFTARFGRSAPRAPARAWMAGELRGRRALIVDDNAAALDVLARTLAMFGVTADRAGGGEQALAMVEAAPATYSWLLIDWKMPGLDGIECARELLRRHPQLASRVLLVTGFARDDALRASAGLPLAGVLHKPITPSSLHDCLAQARREAPAASEVAVPARATPLAQAVRQHLAGARVLLAEDHPLNQELACELLRRAGIEVVVARDGREALDKLEREGPFDGVLMDCQMPVMDGYSATRELRSHEKWRDLPVIAMTASALTEDRERALASGMNAHITKPIHVESMLRTMAQWIAAPGAAPLPPAPAGAREGPAPDEAIDTAAGLAFCVGNEALYRRLLEGFRDSEAGFAAEIGAALAEQRRSDALRRAHDMKGLSGTIGAGALQAAVIDLHAALSTEAPAGPSPALLERVAHELARVLEQIELLEARA